jgi:hypothetical protein
MKLCNTVGNFTNMVSNLVIVIGNFLRTTPMIGTFTL